MQPVVQLATHMLHGNDNYVLEKLTLCRQTWHHTSVEGNMKYDKTLMLAIACRIAVQLVQWRIQGGFGGLNPPPPRKKSSPYLRVSL